MKIWWSQLNQSNCNHKLHVIWYNLSLLFLYEKLGRWDWKMVDSRKLWILICCCRTDYLRLPPYRVYHQKVWITLHYLITKVCLQYSIIIDPPLQPHWNSLCACFNHNLLTSEFIFFCDKTKNKNKLKQSITSWPLWCRQKHSLHCYLVV